LKKLDKYEWATLIVAFVVMMAALIYVPTNGYDFDYEEPSSISTRTVQQYAGKVVRFLISSPPGINIL